MLVLDIISLDLEMYNFIDSLDVHDSWEDLEHSCKVPSYVLGLYIILLYSFHYFFYLVISYARQMLSKTGSPYELGLGAHMAYGILGRDTYLDSLSKNNKNYFS